MRTAQQSFHLFALQHISNSHSIYNKLSSLSLSPSLPSFIPCSKSNFLLHTKIKILRYDFLSLYPILPNSHLCTTPNFLSYYRGVYFFPVNLPTSCCWSHLSFIWNPVLLIIPWLSYLLSHHPIKKMFKYQIKVISINSISSGYFFLPPLHWQTSILSLVYLLSNLSPIFTIHLALEKWGMTWFLNSAAYIQSAFYLTSFSQKSIKIM